MDAIDDDVVLLLDRLNDPFAYRDDALAAVRLLPARAPKAAPDELVELRRLLDVPLVIHRLLDQLEDIAHVELSAAERLAQARMTSRNSGAAEEPLVCLGGDMWCLFPWVGTYAFFAFERFLKLRCRERLSLSGLDSARPYFIRFKMKADKETFFRVLREEAEKSFDPMELVYPGETPVFEKYDEYIPPELVRKGFAYGILDIEGMRARIRSW